MQSSAKLSAALRLSAAEPAQEQSLAMSREVAVSGRWLGGAGITAVIYLIATVAAGGRHPVWPYTCAVPGVGCSSFGLGRL